MDKQEKVRFTMRISQELLDKLGYIAEYYGRTKNKELEQMRRAGRIQYGFGVIRENSRNRS